MFIMLY